MEWHLNRPPFPPLTANDDDECFWYADGVRVDALWPEPTRLVVQTDSSTSGEPEPPSDGQRATFEGLAEFGLAARASALTVVRERGLRFGSSTTADLAGRLDLLAVVVGGVERDGLAYYSLEFTCDEYDDHGIGVVLHRDRVVEVGVADDARDLTGAFEDSEPGAAADTGA